MPELPEDDLEIAVDPKTHTRRGHGLQKTTQIDQYEYFSDNKQRMMDRQMVGLKFQIVIIAIDCCQVFPKDAEMAKWSV